MSEEEPIARRPVKSRNVPLLSPNFYFAAAWASINFSKILISANLPVQDAFYD